MSGIFRAVAAAVAPAECHVCGAALSVAEEWVCSGCLSRLTPLKYFPGSNNPLVIKLYGRLRFEEAAAGYVYEPGGRIAALIQDFKYRDFPGLAEFMGRLVARHLVASAFFSDVEVVVPVPIHWTRRLRRGYNQAEQFARGVCREAGLEVADVLRARFHASQTTRTHEQRAANARGKYRCVNPMAVKGRHVLLVDDVCTTGATVISAAEALRSELPDLRISVLTLACTV